MGGLSSDKIGLKLSDRDLAEYEVARERKRLEKEKAKQRLTKRIWEP